MIPGDGGDPVDAARVPDVAGMITDAAVESQGDATRVWDLVVPPLGMGPPLGVVPILEAVNAAACQPEKIILTMLMATFFVQSKFSRLLQMVHRRCRVRVRSVLHSELVVEIRG